MVLCLTFICSASFAQYWDNHDTQVSLSINGGSAVSFFQLKPANSNLISNSVNFVGYLGASLDFKINNYFSISPALALAGKGAQVEELSGQFGATATESYELYYLQGAVSFIFHIPLGNQANIFLGTGPFYGRSIFGTSKINDNGDENDGGVKFGNGGDFKNIDYGVTSVIGFQTEKGYIFGLNFDFGLPNIHQANTYYLSNDQIRTRTFYISIGKSF